MKKCGGQFAMIILEQLMLMWHVASLVMFQLLTTDLWDPWGMFICIYIQRPIRPHKLI